MRKMLRAGKNLLALALIISTAVLAGCRRGSSLRQASHRYEFSQPHMGTVFAITLYAPDENMARHAVEAAFARVAELNRVMTDYDPESELMRLSQQPVGLLQPVSADLFQVLAESRRVAELTEGAFDPTIGPVVRLWRRARRTESLPMANQLAYARESVGWQKLSLDASNQTVRLLATNMQLDLGGIAKGYAADAALQVLRRQGIHSALVAASGDIAVGDAPPGQRGWRVAIGTPFPVEGRVRELILKNAAVSTSGDSEQFVVIAGNRYSHIVDPRTGMGLTNRCQVSIVASHATQTDALATAISILGPEKGRAIIKSQPGISAIIYRKTTASWEVTEIDGHANW